jgi:hypothetical protein
MTKNFASRYKKNNIKLEDERWSFDFDLHAMTSLLRSYIKLVNSSGKTVPSDLSDKNHLLYEARDGM